MINQTFKNFPSSNWIGFLKENGYKFSFRSPKDEKSFLRGLTKHVSILLTKGHVETAIENIIVGIYIDKVYFLSQLKKSGILRHSSYLIIKNPIIKIANSVIENTEFLGLSDNEINYFNSLINANCIYDELLQLNDQINGELLKFKPYQEIEFQNAKYKVSKLKALLVLNELNFTQLNIPDRSLKDLHYYDFYTIEDISEGISLLVWRYNDLIGISMDDAIIADENYLYSPDIFDLVVNACRFKALKELEILIEVYEYICIIEGEDYKLYSRDEMLDKSIELSNILYKLQGDTNVYKSLAKHQNVMSLIDVANYIHKSQPELFTLKENIVKRYTLLIPTTIHKILWGNKGMSLFREEINLLENIAKELLLTIENTKNYQIRPGLTYYDFIQLYRFLIFISILWSIKIDEIDLENEDNQKALVHSLGIAFNRNRLINILSDVYSKEKVTTFLELLSWDISETNKILDLQYTPLIKIEENYIISLCLTARSNLPRNVLVSESRNKNNTKEKQAEKHTSISGILAEIFKEREFLVRQEVRVKFTTYSQDSSDIDFMAYKDGVLIIAECKDTFHSIDMYEMRTTFDHLKKAASQLKYIQEALNNSEFKIAFCKANEIPIGEIHTIQPIIIMSNNKFWGYSIEDIPVRNIREMGAFITDGKWRFSCSESEILNINLWASNDLGINDIIKFCSKEGPHSVLYNSLNSHYITYGKNIKLKSYTLDIMKSNAYYMKHFKHTISAT